MSEDTKAAPINLHNGWSFPSLAELAREKLSYGANSPSREFVPGQYRYIRITDIDEYGNLNQDVVGIDFDSGREYELADNDFLFARSGNTVGKTFLFEYEKHGKCAYAGYLIRFRADIDKLDPFYVKHYCQSEMYSNWVTSKIRAGAQPNINAKEYGSLRLPLPPLPEQKKIAKILSTWDDAIAANEELLANSRQRKKALMQQLLTGKTRLPGFGGEWKRYRLSDFGSCIRGVSYKPEYISSTENQNTVRLLRSSNIQSNLLNDHELVIIPEEYVNKKQILLSGDLVICMANGSKALVGKAAPFKAVDKRYTVGAFCAIFRPHPTVSRKFSKFLFESPEYQRQLLLILAGSSINNLKGSDIEAMSVPAPADMSEQDAIASVLALADEEIEALEQRINNLKTQKKALMQQLLTGKKRVKVDQIAA